MLAPASLREVFAEKGIDLKKPIITSCGSGTDPSTSAMTS